MTDQRIMASLADKAVIIIIGRFLRAGIKLTLALILVRLLSKHDYGTYRQVILVYEIAMIFFLLGIPTSIFYLLPRSESNHEKQVVVFQSGLFLFIVGLILAVLLYFAAGLFGYFFKNPELAKLFRIFALFPAFDFPANILPPVLISLNKHKEAAIANVVLSFTFTLPILIPLIFGYSLVESFSVLLIIALLQAVAVFFIFIQLLPGVQNFFDFAFLKQQLKYSIPAGLSGMVTLLSQQLDKFIVSIFFVPSIFAVYSVGARELPFINIIPYAVSSVLFPRLAKLYKNNDYDNLMHLWRGAVRKTALLLIPMAPFFFISANEVITILYSSKYIESVKLFQIYLLLIPLRVTALNSVLLSMGKSKFVLFGTLLTLFLNAVLNVIFLFAIGITGPAIATVLTSILISYFFVQKISKELGKKPKDLLPWNLLMKVSSISFLSGIIVWPLKNFHLNSVLFLFFLSVIYSIVYVGASLFFKTILPADLAQLTKWLKFKVWTWR